MSRDDFPVLEQFLGGYFHQDFLLDYAAADDAIQAFVVGEAEATVRAAREELERLTCLVARLDDPGKLLLQLGCYYNPEAEGLSVRDWLQHVLDRLSGG
jgi:hypothetical protein